MEKTIDRCISIAGNKGIYQWTLLLLVFFIWMSNELHPIAIPFLEKMPIVNYRDKISGKMYYNKTLNYTICSNSSSILVVKASGHSFISEFDITCDKLKVSFMGTSIFLGIVVGITIYPYLANSVGRRWGTLIGSLGYSFTMLLLSFTFDYYWGIVWMFFAALMANISAMNSINLVYEVITKDYLPIFSGIVNCAFSFCGITIILCFKYLNSWKIPYGGDSVFNLITAIAFFFFAEESPRFLIANGKVDEFLYALQKIAKINRNEEIFIEQVINAEKPDKEEFVENENENEEQRLKIADNEQKEEIRHFLLNFRHFKEHNFHDVSSHTVFSLLTFQSQRTKFLLLNLIWFVVGFTYYSITVGLKNLAGDIYLNGIILYVIDGVGYLSVGWLVKIHFLGRVKVFWIGLAIPGVIFIAIGIGDFSSLTRTILYLCSRLFIALIFQLCYAYSGEVYPTVLRSQGLSINAVCSKIGACISPFIYEYLEFNIIYIVITFMLAAFISSFFLKETIDEPMLDFIPEEEEEMLKNSE